MRELAYALHLNFLPPVRMSKKLFALLSLSLLTLGACQASVTDTEDEMAPADDSAMEETTDEAMVEEEGTEADDAMEAEVEVEGAMDAE